jgi:hypothetical protein
MDPSSSRIPLRDHFVGWQCRLRRQVVRREGGRPSPGMRPRVTRTDGSEIAPAITVLLLENEPAATTDVIRHIVRRTHDPRQRYENGLRFLSAAHYQDAQAFSDVLTGLFSVDSTVAAALVAEGRCVLHFEQGTQGYQIPCTVRELEEEDDAYQATYWHNSLFNPARPPEVRLLAFDPDWARASAVPPA